MRRSERNSGFTLIEVSLAIVVGLIVVAGAVVLFNQAKYSAQNSAAKDKLVACAMLVEEMEQRNFGLPDLPQLRQAWKTRRPDDYNKSPWGGTFAVDPVANNCIDGNDNITQATDAEVGSGPGGTPFPGTTVADRGRIYYFRRTSGPLAPYLWLHEFSVYGPGDPESVYRMRGYGVAMLGSKAEQWYFVAGREKNNDPSLQRNAAVGQVGD